MTVVPSVPMVSFVSFALVTVVPSVPMVSLVSVAVSVWCLGSACSASGVLGVSSYTCVVL